MWKTNVFNFIEGGWDKILMDISINFDVFVIEVQLILFVFTIKPQLMKEYIATTETDPDNHNKLIIRHLLKLSKVSGPYAQIYDVLQDYFSRLPDDHTLCIETYDPYEQNFDDFLIYFFE